MRFFSILSVIAIISTSSFPVGMIGIRDDGSHFKYPKSVFVDPESKNMFVADTGNKRIVLLKMVDSLCSIMGPAKSRYLKARVNFCFRWGPKVMGKANY